MGNEIATRTALYLAQYAGDAQGLFFSLSGNGTVMAVGVVAILIVGIIILDLLGIL